MGLVLASSSPRRKEILEKAGFCFKVCASEADESIDDSLTIEENVKATALRKAKEVYDRYKDDIVIGADTVVVSGSEILGKPADKNDAKRMLKLLSGSAHQVYTGIAIVDKNKEIADCVVTDVIFRKLNEIEIDEYIATGEPFDKAGAYGIQERGSLLVKEVRGDYFNVMGLPISRLNEILREHFGF